MAGVTYRGFGDRTTLTRWGLAAVAVGIVGGATLPGVLDGLATLAIDAPGGLPWLLERVFAFMAYLAMTGSVVYGLLLSTRLLDAVAHRPINFNLHQDLAIAGVLLAAVHGALLMLDATVPFSLAQVLVPGLAPHAPVAVAVGQVALYIAAVVTLSFYARRWIGKNAWRALHYLTFLAFVGVTAHGIASGSDSGSAWAQGLYLGSAAVVTFLFVYRVTSAILDRRAASQPADLARLPFVVQRGR